MPDIGVCKHQNCKCKVPDEEKFCSDQCRDAAEHVDVPGTMCDCGHEVCG